MFPLSIQLLARTFVLCIRPVPLVDVDSQHASVWEEMAHPSALQNVLGDNRELLPNYLAKIADGLEVPENFAILNGSSRGLAVMMRHPFRKAVFKIMPVVSYTRRFPKFVRLGENSGKGVFKIRDS